MPVPVTASGVLYAVAATSWNDVWAVGSAENGVTQVVILHWNGRGWTRAPYRGPAGSSYLTGWRPPLPAMPGRWAPPFAGPMLARLHRALDWPEMAAGADPGR